MKTGKSNIKNKLSSFSYSSLGDFSLSILSKTASTKAEADGPSLKVLYVFPSIDICFVASVSLVTTLRFSMNSVFIFQPFLSKHVSIHNNF